MDTIAKEGSSLVIREGLCKHVAVTGVLKDEEGKHLWPSDAAGTFAWSSLGLCVLENQLCTQDAGPSPSPSDLCCLLCCLVLA